MQCMLGDLGGSKSYRTPTVGTTGNLKCVCAIFVFCIQLCVVDLGVYSHAQGTFVWKAVRQVHTS